MNVVRVDKKGRVRFPRLKPGQVYSYVANPEGSITLRQVKPVEAKAPRVRVVVEGGRKLLCSDRAVSNEDVQKVLREFNTRPQSNI